MANPHENSERSPIRLGLEEEKGMRLWLSSRPKNGALVAELEKNLSRRLEGALKQDSKRESVRAQEKKTKRTRRSISSNMFARLATLEEDTIELDKDWKELAAKIKALEESQGSLDLVVRQIIVFFSRLFGKKDVLYPEQEANALKKELTRSSRVLRQAKTILHLKQKAHEEVQKQLEGKGENTVEIQVTEVVETAEDQKKGEALQMLHYIEDIQKGKIAYLEDRKFALTLQKASKDNIEKVKQQLREEEGLLKNISKHLKKSQEAEVVEKQQNLEAPRVENHADAQKIEDLNSLITILEAMSDKQFQQQPGASKTRKQALDDAKKQLEKYVHTHITFTTENGKKIDLFIPIRSFQQNFEGMQEGEIAKALEERDKLFEKLWEKHGIKEKERDEFGRKVLEVVNAKTQEGKTARRANNINQLGFKKLWQRGDGHCLFRSLAHGLTGKRPPRTNKHTDIHIRLRKAACVHIWEHRDRLSLFQGSAPSKKQIQKFCTSSDYGANMHAWAIGEMFESRIQYYRKGNDNTLERWGLADCGSPPGSKNIINVVYIPGRRTGNEHYELLIDKNKEVDRNGNFTPNIQGIDFERIVNEYIRKGEEAGLFEKTPKHKVKKAT